MLGEECQEVAARRPRELSIQMDGSREFEGDLDKRARRWSSAMFVSHDRGNCQ